MKALGGGTLPFHCVRAFDHDECADRSRLTKSRTYFSRSIASDWWLDLSSRRAAVPIPRCSSSRSRVRALCTCDFEFPAEHPKISAISSCLYPCTSCRIKIALYQGV